MLVYLPMRGEEVELLAAMHSTRKMPIGKRLLVRDFMVISEEDYVNGKECATACLTVEEQGASYSGPFRIVVRLPDGVRFPGASERRADGALDILGEEGLVISAWNRADARAAIESAGLPGEEDGLAELSEEDLEELARRLLEDAAKPLLEVLGARGNEALSDVWAARGGELVAALRAGLEEGKGT
jgi:hypothetical protein